MMANCCQVSIYLSLISPSAAFAFPVLFDKAEIPTFLSLIFCKYFTSPSSNANLPFSPQKIRSFFTNYPPSTYNWLIGETHTRNVLLTFVSLLHLNLRLYLDLLLHRRAFIIDFLLLTGEQDLL